LTTKPVTVWSIFSAACAAAHFVSKDHTGSLSTACTAAHLTTKPVTVLSIFSAVCTAALSIERAEVLVLKGCGSLHKDIKSQMPKNFWLTWIYSYLLSGDRTRSNQIGIKPRIGHPRSRKEYGTADAKRKRENGGFPNLLAKIIQEYEK
jgi:hypothetical protein